MKFSTQNLLSIREWQTHAEVYRNAVEECRLADELGFDVVWLAEHHFSPYGICPSLAPLTPFDVLRKNYDAYRAEWRATHGTDEGAEICLNKIIHVAETSKQAREELKEPISWFFHTQAGLIADPTGAPPDQYRFYRRVRENLLSLTEDKALDQAAIAGDPEEVADKIRMHREALDVTHFMGAFSRGGLAHDKIVRSMRLFAEKVLPKVA